MAEMIRKVQYFYVMAPDRPGEGARALETLREAGVNLLAFSGFPVGKRAQLDFDAIEPDDLPEILAADGSLKRGSRTLIAKSLGIRDAGNYRPRIDAVLDFIQANADELLSYLYPAPANSNGGSVELLENPDPESNESNADELPWAVGE